MATATPAVPPAARPGSDKSAERRFYSSYTIAIALLIVVGFAPSFYLRGMIEPRRPLAELRLDAIAHGLVASSFLIFLPLQSWLIASGRRALHVKLGKWGFVVGLAFLASLYVVAAFSHHNVPTDVPGLTPAMLSAPSLFAIICAAVLLWLAWRKRFDAQAHKRLIIALACLIAGPGIARLPYIPPPPAAFVIVDGIILLGTIPLLAWDLATRRRPHWATLTGMGAIAAMFAATMASGPFPGLTAFVNWLPGYGWP
jgi:cytochrome bd-type quinol oxidase subunit 2